MGLLSYDLNLFSRLSLEGQKCLFKCLFWGGRQVATTLILNSCTAGAWSGLPVIFETLFQVFFKVFKVTFELFSRSQIVKFKVFSRSSSQTLVLGLIFDKLN